MSLPSIDEIDRTIGQALRSMRLSRTYTQEELGNALGVTRTAVTHYEAGTRSLNAAQLVLAAYILNCTLEQLVPAVPGITVAPTAPMGEPTSPVTQIMHILAARPDLVGNVLDLLETMLQLSEPDAVIGQPIITT